MVEIDTALLLEQVQERRTTVLAELTEVSARIANDTARQDELMLLADTLGVPQREIARLARLSSQSTVSRRIARVRSRQEAETSRVTS